MHVNERRGVHETAYIREIVRVYVCVYARAFAPRVTRTLPAFLIRHEDDENSPCVPRSLPGFTPLFRRAR